MDSKMEDWSPVALVVDPGTSMLRVGYSGDEEPTLQWPNLLGTPKSEEQRISFGLKHRYIGEEAQKERERLSLKSPMKGGRVEDWDAMELVLKSAFGHLGTDPDAHSVIMSDRPLTPHPHRELMTQMMFEKFRVPQLYVMNQGVLCTMAAGRDTAVVLDCGEGATTVMPIEGLSIRPNATYKGDVSGADLTEYVHTTLMQRHYDITGLEGLERARILKESLCSVSGDTLGSNNSNSLPQRVYKFPDDQRVTLNEEQVTVPEALFQPSIIGKSGDGVHELLVNSIRRCDIDARRDLYLSIIPVGGSTCFPGFDERLKKEVEGLVPSTVKVNVVNMFEVRKTAAFVGASILGCMDSFQDCWITRQEYEDHGPTIVHKKCT